METKTKPLLQQLNEAKDDADYLDVVIRMLKSTKEKVEDLQNYLDHKSDSVALYMLIIKNMKDIGMALTNKYVKIKTNGK